MRRMCVFVGFVAATLSVSASAETVVTISKSQQRLSVTVDGNELYRWPVSTGRRGLDTPSGTFHPIRFERKWYSRKYDWSPMPYSVFFHGGYAMHGTTEKRHLGHPASHGCVRLLPVNAATLFGLLRKNGKADTRIVVTNDPLPPPGARFPDIARNVPTPPAAFDVMKTVAIEVPLPPIAERVFENPVAVAAVKLEIVVPLPPEYEPVFEKPVAVAAVKPAPQAEIVVPLPLMADPVSENPVASALAQPAARLAPEAVQALASVPLPPARAPRATAEHHSVRAAHEENGPYTSAGTEAEVMRGREAWLRSLDRKYRITR